MPVYLNEKTKKYFITFYYVDWDGTRKRKKKEGFDTKRKAIEYQRDFLNKKAGDCSIQFSVLLDHYLNDYKVRRKMSSLSTVNYNISKHFLPTFGEIPLSDITPLVVRNWQNNLIKQNYAPNYQKWLSGCLSAVFNYAVRYYGLKSNPVRLAGPVGGHINKKISFWTVEEFNRFLVALRERKEFPICETISHQYVAFNILFYTGIRLGELLALTFKDYDQQARTLQINKTLTTINGKPVTSSPKTPTSVRTIQLSPKICDMLDNYIDTMYNPQPTDFLFYPMVTKYKLKYSLEKAAKVAALSLIRIHDLRHSHASLLIELRISPLAISERLGHKDVQTTLNIYSHLYPNKGEELAKKLDKFIKF